jgi:hypothetical protein
MCTFQVAASALLSSLCKDHHTHQHESEQCAQCQAARTQQELYTRVLAGQVRRRLQRSPHFITVLVVIRVGRRDVPKFPAEEHHRGRQRQQLQGQGRAASAEETLSR